MIAVGLIIAVGLTIALGYARAVLSFSFWVCLPVTYPYLL